MITEIPNKPLNIFYPAKDEALLWTEGTITSHPSDNNGCTGLTTSIFGTEIFTTSTFPNDDIYVLGYRGTTYDDGSANDKPCGLLLGDSGSEVLFSTTGAYSPAWNDDAYHVSNCNRYMFKRPLRVPRATRGFLSCTETDLRMWYCYGPLRKLPHITKPHNTTADALVYEQEYIGDTVTHTGSSTQYAFGTVTEVVASLSNSVLLSVINITAYRSETSTSTRTNCFVLDICTGAAGAESPKVRIPLSFMLRTPASGDARISEQIVLPIMYKFPSGARLSVRVASSIGSIAYNYKVLLTGYFLS